jgi:hypothetical protein
MSRDWIGKADNSGSLGSGDKITIGTKDYILGELLFFRGIPTAMIRLNEKERSITLYSDNYGSFQISNMGKTVEEFWAFINDSCKIN